VKDLIKEETEDDISAGEEDDSNDVTNH
jgi:hypothetical protein